MMRERFTWLRAGVVALALGFMFPGQAGAQASVPSAVPGCGPAAASGPGGGDWRTYGQDLSNTRYQEHEKTIGPSEASTLGPTWSFSANANGNRGGDFAGHPLVADGCAYIGTIGGTMWALNADTGKVVWKKDFNMKEPGGKQIEA